MKALLALLMTVQAFSTAVIPQRTVTPPLNIFSKVKISDDGQVRVSVSKYDSENHIHLNKDHLLLPRFVYDHFRDQSLGVYRMIPKEVRHAETDYQGTAFHIGHNLVLTNHHVLSPDRKNSKDCGIFQLRDNDSLDTFPCKKVHMCHKEADLCLIEMADVSKGFTKDENGNKIPLVNSLKRSKALKLRATYQPSEDTFEDIILTAIGNSDGKGLHFSQGKGVSFNQDKNWTKFYAPITHGNSGGPLLDEAGLVVGVIKLETRLPKKKGGLFSKPKPVVIDPTTSFNIALSIESTIQLIREALAHDPETLERFNQSVVQ